jgi:hypothetical protein
MLEAWVLLRSYLQVFAVLCCLHMPGPPYMGSRLTDASFLDLQVKRKDAVDCAKLAAQTEGYSGADLRAIVSEAQLTAVMAHLEGLKAAEAAGSPHDNHATQEAPALTAAVRFPALYIVESSLQSIVYLLVVSAVVFRESFFCCKVLQARDYATGRRCCRW